MRALLFPRCRCLLFQSNGGDDGPNATLDLIAPGLAAGHTREGMTASLKGRGGWGFVTQRSRREVRRSSIYEAVEVLLG